MVDPLTAEERVQFNVLQRKIEEHRKQNILNLQTFLNVNFTSSHNSREDAYIVLTEHANDLILLLQPFATKEHT